MSSKKYIQVHPSLSQMEKEQAKYIAAQNPVERIKETVQLILRVYGEPKKSENSKRIFIDKE